MKKIFVIGVIALFIGVGVQPAFANIMENNPPYEPSNPIPPDGSTNVSSYHIILRWTGGDPDGDEVLYDVCFGISIPPPLKHKDITYNYTVLFCLEFNTTYYWQIVATDEHGASTPSPIWTFTTTGNSPPHIPILVDYNNYTIYFYSIDPDGDDIRYHIDWDDGTTEVTNWFPSGEIVGMSHSWVEGVYLVRIKAEDIYGAEACCLYFEIKIGNSPPFAPEAGWSPKYPKIGEIINLTFNAVDPDGDDVRFLIDWSDGNSECTPYVPSGINKSIFFTAFKNGAIYIDITAEDGNGAMSDITTVKIIVGKSKAALGNMLLLRIIKRFPLLRRLLSIRSLK